VLVDTLSLKPLLRPIVEVKSLVRLALIKTLLHGADEIAKLRVFPGKALEIDLETPAEDFPAHEEDKLLDHTRALTVSDTID